MNILGSVTFAKMTDTSATRLFAVRKRVYSQLVNLLRELQLVQQGRRRHRGCSSQTPEKEKQKRHQTTAKSPGRLPQ